ncbi:MAG: ADP-glyceromanno-heptose 6-epimerase [Candidatus Auribacter fodinae]|jgi:ADP-L-glycero-D-manno-heptose 6-epimerase|uniref:ADP-L-glycero-D-manno-heptose-6-epimerase n=1 Tax=Candidatus Auribacter fodinae TaxID=2093366 RepID=A0A3A4R9A9_9BACT|nr:MAG: ADP-glyceromanno-heptose 6-epimerase [Candidatus Auribacter fodinae]
MILITGAAGFIGSALACALNRIDNTNLILCDAFGNKEKWKNLLGLRFDQFVDRSELFSFLEDNPLASDIETVIHLGACADTTEHNVDFLYQNNINFSVKLCKWAVSEGVRFLYASSAAVYGDGSLGFSDDDELTPQLRPLNAYGFSKWMFDMWVLEHGLADKVAGMRFFNVFGPNEYHKDRMASVIFRSFPQARDEGKIMLFESHKDGYGHGGQERDFIYIDEVIEAVLFLLKKKKANGIFNIGTGRAHTFNQLAEGVFDGLGKKRNIQYFPMPEDLRGRYQYHTQADMSKLESFGFAGFSDKFSEYVQKYVREYLSPGYLYYPQV